MLKTFTQNRYKHCTLNTWIIDLNSLCFPMRKLCWTLLNLIRLNMKQATVTKSFLKICLYNLALSVYDLMQKSKLPAVLLHRYCRKSIKRRSLVQHIMVALCMLYKQKSAFIYGSMCYADWKQLQQSVVLISTVFLICLMVA